MLLEAPKPITVEEKKTYKAKLEYAGAVGAKPSSTTVCYMYLTSISGYKDFVLWENMIPRIGSSSFRRGYFLIGG